MFTRFVDLPGENGQLFPVNPERVAYLRKPGLQVIDRTRVVFDGVSGGVHELLIFLPVDEVKALLEAPTREMFALARGEVLPANLEEGEARGLLEGDEKIAPVVDPDPHTRPKAPQQSAPAPEAAPAPSPRPKASKPV